MRKSKEERRAQFFLDFEELLKKHAAYIVSNTEFEIILPSKHKSGKITHEYCEFPLEKLSEVRND